MKYPNIGQVDSAPLKQLQQWFRILPSPGSQVPMQNCADEEAFILARICARLTMLGGFKAVNKLLE